MKIRLMLKSPDAIYEGVREAVVTQIDSEEEEPVDMHDEIQDRMGKLFVTALSKWIKYREYVEIEIDTDAGTAVVCEQSG